MKEKIVCSFSSGLSSAMMAKILKDNYNDTHELVFIMANSSKENEESLIFADKCDKYFGLNLVYVEADINPNKGEGTRHKVKTFDTLCRDGSVFEKGIIKYGIPSVANKWCNRELKLNPIHSYIKNELGWIEYNTAIGIRADEIDRVSSKRIEQKLIYPLVDLGITKNERNKFWSNMPFTLNLKGYEGNCDLCFEKTNRKLATIHLEDETKINWWKEMEDKYSSLSIEGKDNYNARSDYGNYFLRGNNPFDTIIELSKQKFQKATDEYIYESDLFDQAGSCDGGCNFYL